MSRTDSYRGPRIVARRGRGMGACVWVAPGIGGPSRAEEEQEVAHWVSAWSNLEQSLFLEAVEEAESPVHESVEGSDRRQHYGDFFYDPDNDGEIIDEFAQEVEEVGFEVAAVDLVSPQIVRAAKVGFVSVNVLGQIEIFPWRVPPRRRVIIELACYLALHTGRPLSGEELRVALWPDSDGTAEASAKSLRNYVSELRRALGAEFVPSARGSGYALSAAVQTDWDQLKSTVVKAKAEGADEAELLCEALRLVRGRPFAGVDWGWAFAESLVSEMEVTISQVAQRLAALSMETEDFSTAGFAARQGLLANPFDGILWEIALRAAAGRGSDELLRTWRDAQATLGDDAKALAELVGLLGGA
jgi:DNA-binding SARP family transcriptional activator